MAAVESSRYLAVPSVSCPNPNRLVGSVGRQDGYGVAKDSQQLEMQGFDWIGCSDGVTCVTLPNDGSRVVSGSTVHGVHLWGKRDEVWN